jgi:hypothetical protein
MKVNYCEQRSDEWFEAKWGLLGGSTVKELMTPSKKANETLSFYKLLMQNMEDIDLNEVNGWVSSDVQRGIDMEPYACQALEDWLIENKNYDPDFQWSEVGLITTSKYKYLSLSPDRVDIELGKKIACEVKCPNGATHARYLVDSDTEPIPLDYIWQVVTYFAIIDELEVLYWASYRPENKRVPLYIVELTPESFINIGTAKRPVRVKIEEAVVVLTKKYNELETAIDEQLKRIN